MTLDRPVGRRQTSWHMFSVARETVEKAQRHVCGASGIARVRGRHEAAASWRPYWPGERFERVPRFDRVQAYLRDINERPSSSCPLVTAKNNWCYCIGIVRICVRQSS
ncbi:MAG TPA: hypothetical protein VL485_14590 [Ktedonobacteraceae bacterium]|nr:hypothetical protein [Ktedonobacteraceae bacterium]